MVGLKSDDLGGIQFGFYVRHCVVRDGQLLCCYYAAQHFAKVAINTDDSVIVKVRLVSILIWV